MNRCTVRKHVQERGATLCDCGRVRVGPTVAKNALVITLLDPVQVEALRRITDSRPLPGEAVSPAVRAEV